MTSPLHYRPLRWRDAAFCYRLASDPVVREASEDRSAPTWPRHMWWTMLWLLSPDRRAWVVWRGTERVGLVRVKRTPVGDGFIGVALANHARGKGLGSTVIRWVSQDALDDFVEGLWAKIRRGNEASVKAFGRAGYGEMATIGDFTHMVYPDE